MTSRILQTKICATVTAILSSIALMSALTTQSSAQGAGAGKSLPAPNKTMSPAEFRKLWLKSPAAHSIPRSMTVVVVTPAKLKHQDVLLKLQKQKQVVEAQRLSILSARSSQQLSGGRTEVIVPKGSKPTQSVASQSGITPSANVGTVQSASTSHLSPAINPNLGAVAVCHGPAISAVNGQATGAWISPGWQLNFATIQGCGFGNQRGAVFLEGPFSTPTINMNVEYWSDTAIVAALDPNLSGETDHLGNVALVVALLSNVKLRVEGLNFYAARAEVQLASIPQSAASVQSILDAAGQNTVSVSFISPYSPQTSTTFYSSPNFSAAAVEVLRMDEGRFGSARDSFSFNQLSPGFYIDNLQFLHNDLTYDECAFLDNTTTLYVDGAWNAVWDGSRNALRVTTQEQHCHLSGLGWSYDVSQSDYAIVVSVVGPRGINPWGN